MDIWQKIIVKEFNSKIDTLKQQIEMIQSLCDMEQKIVDLQEENKKLKQQLDEYKDNTELKDYKTTREIDLMVIKKQQKEIEELRNITKCQECESFICAYGVKNCGPLNDFKHFRKIFKEME